MGLVKRTYVDGETVITADNLNDIQDEIIQNASDISTKGTYSKPSGGIPSTDMTTAVQTSLGKADTAYQKPSGGIPSTDLASGVQTSLGKADTAYQKPSGGISSTDLASAVQTSLGKADTALQSSDIDSTLSVSGKAADAKKTGDEISGVKNTLNNWNSYNVLDKYRANTATTGGVTITNNGDGSYTFSTDGQSTGSVIFNIYYSETSLPEGMKAGEKYYVDYSSDNIYVRFMPFDSSGALPSVNYMASGEYTVPSNAIGMAIRFAIGSGVTASGTVTPRIFNAYSNKKLMDQFDTAFEGKTVKVLAGVIRNDGTGWKFIDDSGHTKINANDLVVTGQGQLILRYGFTSKKILSFVICPDDDFAGIYTCGASVGDQSATIGIYRLPKTYGGISLYQNGAWSTSLTNVTNISQANSGLITVTFPDVSSDGLSPIVIPFRFAGSCSIESYGVGNVQFYLRDSSGNIITSPSKNTGFSVHVNSNSKLMNANDVVSGTGNFWIIGIFEV